MKLHLSQSEAMDENHPDLYSDASETIDLGTTENGENYVPIIYNMICDPGGFDVKVYLDSTTGLWVAPSGVHYSDATISL
jgi:hypothetical protein